jgi:hypothetical protein
MPFGMFSIQIQSCTARCFYFTCSPTAARRAVDIDTERLCCCLAKTSYQLVTL